jgi:hypothetical protein
MEFHGEFNGIPWISMEFFMKISMNWRNDFRQGVDDKFTRCGQLTMPASKITLAVTCYTVAQHATPSPTIMTSYPSKSTEATLLFSNKSSYEPLERQQQHPSDPHHSATLAVTQTYGILSTTLPKGATDNEGGTIGKEDLLREGGLSRDGK